jgi:hypothetical protein
MTENMLYGPARATRSHMLCEGTVTDWANAHENSRTASEGAGRPMSFIQPQIQFSSLLSRSITYDLYAFDHLIPDIDGQYVLASVQLEHSNLSKDPNAEAKRVRPTKGRSCRGSQSLVNGNVSLQESN